MKKNSHSYDLLKLLVVGGAFWFLVVILFYPTPKIESEEIGIKDEAQMYNVKKKMYSEMGFQPKEKSWFGVDKSNIAEFEYWNAKNAEKAKSSNDDDGDEFVKPPNIFGFENVGEMGGAMLMPENLPPEIKKLVDEGWKNNSFNQYLSDLISVRRKLPDYRSEYCKKAEESYDSELPATSVIIIFHNEAWSTLLRSVHSVLDRSPANLITEIILVDDFSDMTHLKQPLDKYMAKLPKVKILRAEKREGLIRARIRGAVAAKGPVLTFLDSHIECTTGWLEPLLDRIVRDPTKVPCPIIDLISDTTFEYVYLEPTKNPQIGGFDWRLVFRWHMLPERQIRQRKDMSEPVASPTMAGGLFSIDKAFFVKLGMYDPDFDIWGAENLELSFKSWMCGGEIEIIPCSHVGHIYRKVSPYKWRSGVDVVRWNSIRLAEVWMDEYAKYFYIRTGRVPKDFGDISARVKLRKDLGCKSFKWYLNNIYPEQFDPSTALSQGSIRSFYSENEFCITNNADDVGKIVAVTPCRPHLDNQFFWLTPTGEIRRDNVCLDFPMKGTEVITFACHDHKGTQLWTFLPHTNQIFHNISEKCLTFNTDSNTLIIEGCITGQVRQKWLLDNYINSTISN